MSYEQKSIDRVETASDAHVEVAPTLAEMALLRRLRTLNGADYEAQYFDNKPMPRGDFIKKIGNPSALYVPIPVRFETSRA